MTLKETQREISSKQFIEKQKKQGLMYAIRLLSISKRSESNLISKLKEKGYGDEAIGEIVDDLKEKKYLDDLQMAKNITYWSQQTNSMGKRRIRLELKKKGVSDQVITRAFEESPHVDEEKLAFDLAKTRYDKLKNIDRLKKKKRLLDFLGRRGFDYEICWNVINKLESQTHEN